MSKIYDPVPATTLTYVGDRLRIGTTARVGVGSTRLLCVLCERHGFDGTVYAAGRACRTNGWNYPESDEECYRFVKGLYKRDHMKPFEYPALIVKFQVPIFVARQLRTYQNTAIERSQRACEPLELDAAFQPTPDDPLFEVTLDAVEKYKKLIAQGLKREEARRAGTVDFLTQVYHKIHIRQAFHIFDQRLAPEAQSETQEVVKSFYQIVKWNFPILTRVYEESKSDEWKAKFLTETTTEKMIV